MKKINTVVWKEDGLYVARALEVEVASQGYTEEEASANLKEALELYFEDHKIVDLNTINNPKLINLII